VRWWFWFLQQILAGIRARDSRFLIKRTVSAMASAENGPLRCRLESALEEQTFEPRREIRAASTSDGRKMAMTRVCSSPRREFDTPEGRKFSSSAIALLARFLNHSRATVAFVTASIRMKLPVVRFTRVGIEK